MNRSAIAVSLVALLSSMAAHGAENPEVRPGGVVRWPGGPEVTACLVGGEEYPPLDGTCWYAVDLLTTEGDLEIARAEGGVVQTTTVRVGPYPYPEQRLQVAPKHVDLSDADAERARRETQRVAALWSRRTPRRARLPLAAPLEPMPAARSFGSRRVFNDQPRGEHTGIDLSAATGTPVRAVADGTVVLAADHFFSGRSVFVDHGDGLLSMYFHLDTTGVEEGVEIERGQRLGTVGATGRVTGPHLHFGLRWRGARIDPMVLIGPPDRVPTVTAD